MTGQQTPQPAPSEQTPEPAPSEQTPEPAPSEQTPAESAPILEFDPDRSAMIEPSSHFGTGVATAERIPDVVVACFFGDVVERVAHDRGARVAATLVAEHGRHHVWAMQAGGREVAFYQAGLGAPLAAGFLEDVIEYGATTVVAVGGCGALDPRLTLGHVVVVREALRDEGTSYHYMPVSRTVETDPHIVSAIESILAERGVPFSSGMTWTTDAFYRETRAKVARRREEGCIVVEMEAAALLAVARFRGVRFGQLLYAGDSLAEDEWQHRGWLHAHDVREEMFWLALHAASRVADL
jgi:uridine phosphorylase